MFTCSSKNGVMNKGGISNCDVNRKRVKFVNKAHSEYVKQLEKQKEQQTWGEKKEPKKEKLQMNCWKR